MKTCYTEIGSFPLENGLMIDCFKGKSSRAYACKITAPDGDEWIPSIAYGIPKLFTTVIIDAGGRVNEYTVPTRPRFSFTVNNPGGGDCIMGLTGNDDLILHCKIPF